MRDVDYYEILGVGPEAESDEIDQAYQRARIRQGELASQAERARLLVEARAVLCDPSARAEYDAHRVGRELIDETVTAILAVLRSRLYARDYSRSQWELVLAALRARGELT